MGCDGGTIPRRDELVRQKKKPEQKDKDSELSFLWRHCTISQEPLKSPVVSCGLGRLYNKDSVIEALLNKTPLPELASHVKSIKDVKDLSLTVNPAFVTNAEKGDGYIDRQSAPYICPIMGIEMNGRFKFVFLWSCGCVMSERCMKAAKTTLCHKCQKPFTDSDIVILNPNDEDLKKMHPQMEARKIRLKAEKEKKSSTKTSASDKSIPEQEKEKDSNKTSAQPPKITPQPSTSTSTSKLGDNMLKRRTGLSSNLKMEDPTMKKMKGDYSIAKDPKNSDVYKSLFTSHSNAQQQTRAHWVTYNPFYN